MVGIVSFALACSSIAPFSERLEVYGLPAWLSVLLAIITAFLVPEVIVSMGVWLCKCPPSRVLFSLLTTHTHTHPKKKHDCEIVVAPLQQRLARKVLESLQVLVVDTHADGGGVTGGASSPDAIGTGVAGHELATTERRKTHWYKWFAIRASVFVLSFPINAIPLLGQVLYFYINGTLYAWQLQEEYLVLKVRSFVDDENSLFIFLLFVQGYNTRSEQYTYVYFRLYDYAIYGSTCLLFEVLSFVGTKSLSEHLTVVIAWFKRDHRLWQHRRCKHVGGPAAQRGSRCPHGAGIAMVRHAGRRRSLVQAVSVLSLPVPVVCAHAALLCTPQACIRLENFSLFKGGGKRIVSIRSRIC